MNKEIKIWLMAVALAGVVFGVPVRPVLAEMLTRQEVHGLYLASQGVVASDYIDENGFRQIRYEFEGEKVALTKDKFPHANPDAAGEWVTWMAQTGGSWRIFLYSLVSEETVQLTGVGNNVNPVVSKKYVAWEGFSSGAWQVFLFDGSSIRQLTDGESVADIDLNDEWLVYRQREADGSSWRVKIRSLVTDLTVDLGLGMEPKLTDDRLTWLTDVDGNPVPQEYVFNATPTPTATMPQATQADGQMSATPTIETTPTASEAATIGEVIEASPAAEASSSASF